MYEENPLSNPYSHPNHRERVNHEDSANSKSMDYAHDYVNQLST